MAIELNAHAEELLNTIIGLQFTMHSLLKPNAEINSRECLTNIFSILDDRGFVITINEITDGENK